MSRLLLASKSAARRAMLQNAGIRFETVPADADEDAAKAALIREGIGARAIAGRLAELKARAAPAEPNDLVIGSDQVLEQADGSILSKPRSRDDAARQLRGLAGTSHQLHSAAVLVQAGRAVWQATQTASLTMRGFSESFLAEYLDREWEEVRGNVGAYRIEGMGAQMFDKIAGSHFAILGLPLLPLLAELRSRGVVTS